MKRTWLPVLLMAATAACVPSRPPRPPALSSFGVTFDVRDAAGDELGAAQVRVDGARPAQVTTDAHGHVRLDGFTSAAFNACASADGYVAQCTPLPSCALTPATGEWTCTFRLAAVPLPPKPVIAARRGLVRFAPRAAVDDDGPFAPLGVTFFPGVWLYGHDRAVLERELALLRDAHVDFIRVITDGLAGTSWADRVMDSRAPGWAGDVAGLIDLAADSYGIRTELTIFGDLPLDGTARAPQIVDAIVAIANARPSKVLLIEIANEGAGKWGEAALRDLGRRARAATDIPVALSSPYMGDDRDGMCDLYRDDVADVATVHYDRDTSRGPWRPVRKPWEYPWGSCAGLPPVAFNNEPIGPGSSVASDADPLRIVLAYVTTFVAGNGAYVFHAAPGIRVGGAYDAARGIAPSLAGTPNWAAITAGLAAAKQYLPPDLANWSRKNTQWSDSPFAEIEKTIDAGGMERAYWALGGNRLFGVLLGMTRDAPAVSRVTADLELLDPLTGDVLEAFSVTSGQACTFGHLRDGLVVRGTVR